MVSILGANSVVSGGYEVSNSLRFNPGDTPYLSRTPSSAGNRKTYTWSSWVKRSNLSSTQGLFTVDFGSVEHVLASFLSDDTFRVYINNPTNYDTQETTQVFRDVSAWYHIFVAVDTTQSTASDRLKLYVNGLQITSFDATGYPPQNADTQFNTTNPHYIGFYANQTGGAGHFDGYMAEVNFIDGTAKAHTDFGEFDDDSGIWKPKEYTGSYGTNGFFLQFKQTGTSQNSSGIGADTSGNDNHFAVTNLAATDVTEDTCTNNFATFNALFTRTSVNPTFSEGNLKIVQGASNGIAYSTQGVSSGKWYAEIKVDDVGTATSCGILEPSAYDNGNPDTQALYYQSNGNKNNKGSASGYGDSYTTGDIIGIAFDADNGTLAFYKNGVSQGTAFTGLDTNTTWLIGCHGYINSGSSGQSGNYGNPPFAISSGNTDGKYGNFEYAPPSGYYALCTKRLAEFG